MSQACLTVFAGPNGSGKSTLTQKLLDTGIDFGHLLDPDAIARRINPENIRKAALEAARETIQRQRSYLRSRDSFALETTLSGKRETRLIQDAKERGYAITLFYIALNDPRLNIQRVAERVAQGGHNVPTEDILRRYERSMNHLPQAVFLADHVRIYDNSGPTYQKLLAIHKKKVIFCEKSLPDWLERRMPEFRFA